MRTVVYSTDKKYDFDFAVKTIDKEAVAIEQQVMNSKIGQNIIYTLPWADAADKFITSGIICSLQLTKRVIVNKEKSLVKRSDTGFTYYWLVVNKARLDR